MSLITTEAILVHRLPFQNSSLIITWITPPEGRIKTLAKGVLRPQHRLSTSLDLFYLCEISYLRSPGSDLGQLRDARLIHPFLALRREWQVILCAQYFAELLGGLTEPHAEIGEFFAVFEKGLRYLETHLPSRRLVDRYEKKLLDLNGLPSDIPHALERGLSVHHQSPSPLRHQLMECLRD